MQQQCCSSSQELSSDMSPIESLARILGQLLPAAPSSYAKRCGYGVRHRLWYCYDVSPRSPHDLFAQLLGALLQLQVPWKLILVKKLLCLRSFLLSKAATTQALISTEISRFCSLTSPVETLRRHPQVQVSLGYQWRTYLGMNINSTS